MDLLWLAMGMVALALVFAILLLFTQGYISAAGLSPLG
jgi:hypothetical protein